MTETPDTRDADLALLRQVGTLLYGPRWQTPLAGALGVDIRTVQSWAAGSKAPRYRVWAQLQELVQQRQVELVRILPELGAKTHTEPAE